MMAFQRITTEWCWGYAWTRDGLNRKTRSMLRGGGLVEIDQAWIGGRDLNALVP